MQLWRCFHCNVPLMEHEATKEGCCPECGSRKMREAGRIKDNEMDLLVARGFDPVAEGWGQSE